MAQPNAITCTEDLLKEVDFNSQLIPIGTFITATDSPPASNVINTCLEITDNDVPGAGLTATSETYSSCYDCLVANFGVVILSPCGSYPHDRPVFNITDFGYILLLGQTFNLEFTIEGRSGTEIWNGCFQVEGTTQLSEDDYNNLPTIQRATLSQIFFSNYASCEECTNGFSAGTESTICVVCCPCTTGTTITSVSAPHPTWTNGQGQAITLLDAITLGGPNGLNN